MQTAVLVLGLLFLTPVLLASNHQFYIRPSEESLCLGEPCYLLPHVLRNAAEYLISNTTLIFTPGNYFISEQIRPVIFGVNNLTLIGSSNTVVYCIAQFGLIIADVTDLVISNLSFFNCSAELVDHINGLAAVNSDVTLINTSFSNSKGTYIVSEGSNLKFLGKTVFSDNQCGISCGIAAYSSSNVEFLGKVVFSNNTCNIGCGIYTTDNTNISFNGNVVFVANQAVFTGSCIYAEHGSNVEFLGAVVFQNNTCLLGCGIYALSNTTISFNGSVMFVENQAASFGGGVYAEHGSNVGFLGTAVFQNNTCLFGCGISALNDSNISFNGKAMFEENVATGDGSGIHANHSSLKFLGRAVFLNNKCVHGCGIFSINTNISFNGSTTFEGNKAANFGSGLFADGSNLEVIGTAVIQNNTCFIGCGILAVAISNVLFNGSALVMGNEATTYGGGFYVHHSNLEFLETVVFQNNTCKGGCGIFALSSASVTISGSAIFEGNNADKVGAGAMIISNSIMEFNSEAVFHNNRAEDGGAIYLHVDKNAALQLNSGAEINITRNHASQSGGGIHISISQFEQLDDPVCFYRSVGAQPHFKVYLVDNRAEVAGHAIYGNVDDCYFQNNSFQDVFSIRPFYNKSDLSLVTSDQTRLCFCMNDTPNCSIVNQSRTIHPGETLEVPVVAVGSTLEATTGAALAVLPSNASLAEAQTSQALQVPLCTHLKYTIHSNPGNLTMQLVTKHVRADGLSERDAGFIARQPSEDRKHYVRFLHLPIFLHLTLLPCPPGFQVENKTCSCNQALQKHNIFNCSIDDETVYRPNPYWVSASSDSTTVHMHCPLDYCAPYDVPITPNLPDEQCQMNHSGILCGGCKANLSMVFGSSRCLQCSYWWLLLIPVFALAGIILVFVLTVLNLTVSIGAINGLIFYANITRANMAVFFPPTNNTAAFVLSVFIAWLNLDIGVEVCFYYGLDMFAKTLLQLAFPLYVWILVIIIIVSSHYSTRAAKLSGKNSVPVLATLFLLSYAKLLRVVISALSFTTVVNYQTGNLSNSSRRYVWLYDANVQYLKGKHIPLFLAALVILVALSVPYTLVLNFVQCLQRRSSYRVLSWLRRLKPLFDAYTGPYKDRHRYWTGLLLFVRVGIFLVFAVIQNVLDQPSLSLLTIIFVAVSLLCFQGMVGGVYKIVYLNFLESFFLANLVCFSGATFYTSLTGGNQAISVYISVGLALAVFLVIIMYSVYKRLKDSQCVISLSKKRHYTHVAQSVADVEPNDETQPQGRVPSQILFFNELREPVMEYCEENN